MRRHRPRRKLTAYEILEKMRTEDHRLSIAPPRPCPDGMLFPSPLECLNETLMNALYLSAVQDADAVPNYVYEGRPIGEMLASIADNFPGFFLAACIGPTALRYYLRHLIAQGFSGQTVDVREFSNRIVTAYYRGRPHTFELDPHFVRQSEREDIERSAPRLK